MGRASQGRGGGSVWSHRWVLWMRGRERPLPTKTTLPLPVLSRGWTRRPPRALLMPAAVSHVPTVTPTCDPEIPCGVENVQENEWLRLEICGPPRTCPAGPPFKAQRAAPGPTLIGTVSEDPNLAWFCEGSQVLLFLSVGGGRCLESLTCAWRVRVNVLICPRGARHSLCAPPFL